MVGQSVAIAACGTDCRLCLVWGGFEIALFITHAEKRPENAAVFFVSRQRLPVYRYGLVPDERCDPVVVQDDAVRAQIAVMRRVLRVWCSSFCHTNTTDLWRILGRPYRAVDDRW